MMDKPQMVRDAAEFKRMPAEYQELVIHQLRQHTEGELTGADDYLKIFFPLAPNAFERKVCCERAAEEMDHFIRGAEVLEHIGVDCSFMLKQDMSERVFYKTEGVKTFVNSWTLRGLFSWIGEGAVLAMIEEMAESSYVPIRDMCRQVIIDEHVHVAQGHRIIQDICTREGPQAVQPDLEKSWPVVLDMFGRSDSERSKQYLKWGLRKYSNSEARERYIKRVTPQIEALGLRVPSSDRYRKFV